MKKVLFATTALVASASFAVAQQASGPSIALSGSAEMGISGGLYRDADLGFHTDVDVTFTGTGTTDGGLTFGFNIDLDEGIGNVKDGISSNATRNDTKQGGESIFVSGALGQLTMGDTDGALDWAMQEVDILGALADDHTSHAGFNGNGGLDGRFDGQVARYEYTFGDFAFAASAELRDERDSDDEISDDTVIGVGMKYSTEFGSTALGFGIAYQTTGDEDLIGLSVDATLQNGLRAILNYTNFNDDSDGGSDGYHVGVGVGYTFDAFSVAANYGKFDFDDEEDEAGFGLVGNYDLGGGAVLQAGYGKTTDGAVSDDSDDSYSFGLRMDF